MGYADLFFTALGLSMDAFAASLCKGIRIKRVGFSKMLTVGLWFGAFQAFMPLVGYFLGDLLRERISFIDHWISFVLLCLIGASMIKNALTGKDDADDGSLSPGAIIPLALATSLDAMAVGVAFGLQRSISIQLSSATIGIITLFISALGLKLGSLFGLRGKSKAELLGGLILIGIGLKILIGDLFF